MIFLLDPEKGGTGGGTECLVTSSTVGPWQPVIKLQAQRPIVTVWTTAQLDGRGMQAVQNGHQRAQGGLVGPQLQGDDAVGIGQPADDLLQGWGHHDFSGVVSAHNLIGILEWVAI